MKAQKNQKDEHVITAALSSKERELFTALATFLDVSYSTLMLRLVKYLLNGEITWDDLFTQSKGIPGVDEARIVDKSYLRTNVTPEQYAAFEKIAKEWGSAPTVVLRKLVLRYITGDIKRQDVW
jgi:hypothetical protein